jgi:prefoldin subunit 5
MTVAEETIRDLQKRIEELTKDKEKLQKRVNELERTDEQLAKKLKSKVS